MTTGGSWICGAAAFLLAALAAQPASQPAAAREPMQPPVRLADTGLYDPARPGETAPVNRPFAPQYPLWSDGLGKKRWVYLPPGSVIDATDEHEWDFPTGTRFWKEFSQGTRKIETRFLWRTESDGWVFATYVWNEEGTDAVLAAPEGVLTSVPVTPGRTHAVPAATDCTACHGDSPSRPLGFNALQLSPDRDPLAIHGEPLAPGMLTLRTLMDEGRVIVSDGVSDGVDPSPRIRTSDPATRAVLGYLAANCGACHGGRGDISAVAPVLRMGDLLADGDAVARSFILSPTRWQIPGQPEGSTVLVRPGAPELSALLVRLRSRAPSSQMPPLGTVVRDEAAVAAIADWIRGIGAAGTDTLHGGTIPLRAFAQRR